MAEAISTALEDQRFFATACAVAESDGNARLIAAAPELMTTPITHTPGPWKISIGPNLAGVETVQVHNGDDFVCSCGTERSTMPGGLERQKANARLIAAAPALLQVVQQVVQHLDDLPAWFDQARQAIAKATQP